MRFKRQHRIGFGESDPAGVIFYATAFSLAHQTIEAFVDHIGIGWEQWFKNSQFIIPVRHAEADFLGAMEAGKKFDLELSINRLSESTVVFVVEFKFGSQIFAKLQSAHIFVDRISRNKTPIPDFFREKLKPYLAEQNSV